MTFSLVSALGHGTLTFNPDRTFAYQPDTGYNGLDDFTYSVSDGTSSRQSTVFRRSSAFRMPLVNRNQLP
ncbi:MAG: Ig-like domain-containing protein [Pseudomonadota bacterium]